MIQKSLRQSVLTYLRRGVQYASGLFPKLKIPLTNSVVPTLGSTTPSFSRSTAATVKDHEGFINTALINELRFPGARRVRNLLSNSEVLSTQTVTVLSGSSYILSFSGTGSVTLSGAATGALTGTTGRVQFIKTASTTSLTLTVSGAVLQAQLERLTGTQIEASEYVSTGVLSWPYHGAGVDGVEYFNTDREGNSLELYGALIEPSATNLFLYSNAPVTRTVTVVSGSKYVIWGEGTGSIVLSGAGTGTVTEGNPVTITTSSTSLVCTVSNMTFAQVELNAKTSHIITTSSAVTRTADILTYGVADSIIQGQGSVYIEALVYGYNTSSSTWLYNLYSSTSDRISLYITTGGKIAVVMMSSGVNVAAITTTIDAVRETPHKVLITYETNSVSIYIDGELVLLDNSNTIPSMTLLQIGNFGTSYQPFSQLKNFKYFSEIIQSTQAERMTE